MKTILSALLALSVLAGIAGAPASAADGYDTHGRVIWVAPAIAPMLPPGGILRPRKLASPRFSSLVSPMPVAKQSCLARKRGKYRLHPFLCRQ
jgi:hypothetical protein